MTKYLSETPSSTYGDRIEAKLRRLIALEEYAKQHPAAFPPRLARRAAGITPAALGLRSMGTPDFTVSQRKYIPRPLAPLRGEVG